MADFSFLHVLSLIFLSTCSAVPHFHHGHQVGTITSHSILEASGLAASRIHSNVLYTHNDSGGSPKIFAIDKNSGQRLATFYIEGAHSHDWEDIAAGPCPNGGHCIYVGDTGGNAGNYEANYIYRVQEPSSIYDHNLRVDSILHFKWDQRDCETLMVAPDAELYLVSKTSHSHDSKVFHVPKSAWGNSNPVYVSSNTHIAFYSQSPSPVGGDISPDGNEILLKTYGHVYYFSVQNHDYIGALGTNPTALPYTGERQGESVCWDAQGSGYYTTSEGANSPLYYYARYP
ncbi:uncharacterized protein LOC110454086 [Mizuhopecten yessoensis]|uniref:Uncharacterized protein n=1 Tax=Mizuhopecten yessoensis TaxID=6573 RepID=A0A210QFZ4_MIZYE|nr:uncharacterized protein LOC110454086 [Mizuhopecten yessoensis]OWF47662.1 hypothetical protein KP79_PYT22687 [Mizuhopecten yessoensis]